MRKRHNLIVRKELLINFHELMGIKYTSWTSQVTLGRASGKIEKRCFYKGRIMAGVNIFISSTCYDLSQVRQDLCEFISDLGHTPMMSEQNI